MRGERGRERGTECGCEGTDYKEWMEVKVKKGNGTERMKERSEVISVTIRGESALFTTH